MREKSGRPPVMPQFSDSQNSRSYAAPFFDLDADGNTRVLVPLIFTQSGGVTWAAVLRWLGSAFRIESYNNNNITLAPDGTGVLNANKLNTAPSDVSASRSAGTTYTNSTGYPMLVQIMLEMTVENSNWNLKIHATADPPTTMVAAGQQQGSDSVNLLLITSGYTIVPNGWKYRLTKDVNTTIQEWIETQIG